VYTSGGTKGEYVISTSTRTCGICDTGCKFCATSSSKCYICQDSHFLVDNKATCASTFTCQQCTNSSVVTDGCAASDNYCRITDCPAFFYFRVNRTSTGNRDDDPMNNNYLSFTQAQGVDTSLNGYELSTSRASNSTKTSPQGSNPSYFYRQYTNLCVLCDYRCMKCFGPSNLNCTLCVNHYYKWTNATVCSSMCPTGQYQMNISAPYPNNETMCANCDNHCVACIGWSLNCTSCQSFSTTYYAFLYTYYLQNSTCMTTCPTSTNQLTTKGYYGSIATMICYPCPSQCSDCNINLVMDTTNYP
jgi:proprotein convertase subtilisin/kexin type 5